MIAIASVQNPAADYNIFNWRKSVAARQISPGGRMKRQQKFRRRTLKDITQSLAAAYQVARIRLEKAQLA